MAIAERPSYRPPTDAERRRATFARYKQDVKERGKPFFPYAMFHDTVMSLVVVIVIVALACIWKWTAWSPHHTGTHAGILGPEYDAPADPGTVSFVPRPDWYFFFLFYLLRIFKWPETVFLGTIGVPTIALILLTLLPFLDRRRERRIQYRPVAAVGAVLVILSMALLTYKGATAKEALASEVLQAVPGWIHEAKLPPEAEPGAKLFAQAGCTNCHTYLGTGSSNLGAHDLSTEGTSGRGVDGLAAYISNPRRFGNAVMPVWGQFLTQAQIHDLAVFLNASHGRQ